MTTESREIQRIFVGKDEASLALGISTSTLKKWRLGNAAATPVLTEDVHWVRSGSRLVLYNLPLLTDFVANRSNPELHQKAITAYLASLPSSRATA